MVVLQFNYCLFLLTCFGRQKESSIGFDCPSEATCWSAPSAETSSDTDGLSLLCTSENDCSSLLYNNGFSLRSTPINTIVVLKTTINNQTPLPLPPSQHKLSPISVVFDECKFSEISVSANPVHISFFHLFGTNRLRFLTILKTTLQLDWTFALASYSRLDTLYIEGSQLSTLDGTFATLSLPSLRTLVIKSSGLKYIDRAAFSGGLANTIERLSLADNQLKNTLFLTSVQPDTFPNLWYLDLSKNQLTSVPRSFVKGLLPALKELNVADNHFKYYDIVALGMLSTLLQQFTLEGERRNTIYLTRFCLDLHQIIVNSPDPDPRAAFFLDSLKRPRFQLSIGGLVMWDQLTSTSQFFTYLPDSLVLGKEGTIVMGKEEVGSTTRVMIGTDWSTESFSFDEVTNMEQYRIYRTLLVDHIVSAVAPENALRLNLFGKPMIDHMTGQKIMSDSQISMIADLLEEVLDEAAARSTYIILVYYRSEDIPWTETNFPFSSLAGNEGQGNKIREQLLLRIGDHSALLGFELMGNFMGTHPRRPVDMTPNGNICTTTCVGVEREMLVVGRLYYWLGTYFRSVLYGFSIDSSCKACFDLATMLECRRLHFKLVTPTIHEGLDFDFVTFTSKGIGNAEGNDALGFERMTKQQRDALNWRDANIPLKSRAIFYAVSQAAADDPLKREKIQKYSSGFFIKRSLL